MVFEDVMDGAYDGDKECEAEVKLGAADLEKALGRGESLGVLKLLDELYESSKYLKGGDFKEQEYREVMERCLKKLEKLEEYREAMEIVKETKKYRDMLEKIREVTGRPKAYSGK